MTTKFENVKLVDIVECLDSQRIPLNEVERKKRIGPIPYYGANGRVSYVDDYLFDEQLLLLAEDGGDWGPREYSSYIISGKSWVNNHAHVLRCKANVNIYYLMNYLNFVDLRKYITGTTRGKLNQSRINDIDVLFPPLPTQRKIASILEKAEAAREKRKQANHLTDEFLKSAFLEMFGDPVKNTKKLSIVRCGDISTHVSSGSTPLGGEKTYLADGILFIRSQNVQINRLDLSDVAYISDEVHQKMKRTWVKNGDVLLNITGASIGRVAYFNGKNNTANVNQHVCIIRPQKAKILPEYLSFLISMPNYQKKIFAMNAGATRQAFNFEQIKKLEIPLAPLSEQQKFADLVQKVEKLKEKQRESEDELNNLFNSLMQRAFRGEIS
jgi:type I restriction enzyme S subunit